RPGDENEASRQLTCYRTGQLDLLRTWARWARSVALGHGAPGWFNPPSSLRGRAMLNFEPLHPEFGARVTGIDLRAPLSDAARDEILEAIDEYSFLCFPDQPFDDERQLAFTRRLGEPEPSHVAM